MTGEPVEAIYAALEASRHIGECAEHPEHLMDAENKARAAYPALDALVAQRDEARQHFGEPVTLERIKQAHSSINEAWVECHRERSEPLYKQGHDETCYFCALSSGLRRRRPR